MLAIINVRISFLEIIQLHFPSLIEIEKRNELNQSFTSFREQKHRKGRKISLFTASDGLKGEMTSLGPAANRKVMKWIAINNYMNRINKIIQENRTTKRIQEALQRV